MNFGRILWNRTGIGGLLFKRCRNSSVLGAQAKPTKTVVLMIYPGGPKCIEEMPCIVERILMDKMLAYGHLNRRRRKKEIKRVLPKMAKKYGAAGLPIRLWHSMRQQAIGVERGMNLCCPLMAPFQAIVACQFVRPSIFDALRKIGNMECLENIMVLPMYPQFSCGLTGSALNSIYEFNKKNPLPDKVRWLVVDNWPSENHYINHLIYEIRKVATCKKGDEHKFVYLFAARPMVPVVFQIGDFYPYNVGTTVMTVMQRLKYRNQFTVTWDPSFTSENWLRPTTEEAMRDYVCQGYKRFVIIPISAIVDSVVTTYDYDIHLLKHLVPKMGKGIRVVRASAANSSKLLIQGAIDACDRAIKESHHIPASIRKVCAECRSANCVKYRLWFKTVLNKNIKSKK